MGHRRKVSTAIAAAITLCLGTSCAATASHSDSSLDPARVQWAAKGPTHYRMIWYQRAMIGESRVVVEVRDGKVITAKALRDDLQLMPVHSLTVERAFQAISEAETKAATVSASYDRDFGYPRTVHVDVDERSIDDEYDFGIESLKII
jgi:hypothetical protein